MITDNHPTPDFEMENHGTVFLFRPLNLEAEEHLEDIIIEGATWFGDTLVVEHRFASDLASALQSNGWRVV